MLAEHRLRPGFGRVLAAAWAALAAAAGASTGGSLPDDMFITCRYAWNLAHGHGFVFNPGERVFGLTNPGHGLMLAMLHAVTRIPVHVLAAVLFTVALWSVPVLLWREGRARGTGAELAIGGTLVLGACYLWASIGSASAVVLALLAGAALLVPRRPVISGLLAGLAVWYRPDAVLGLAAIGSLAWLERRRFPWKWGVAAAGFILLGVIGAWLWFGTPLPQTLEAKRIMAEARAEPWAGPVRFWARAAHVMPRHFGRGWLLLAGLGLAGQWPLFARGGPAVRTLVLYGAGVAVAYPLLGVPFFSWYAIPVVVVLLLGVGGFGVGVGRGVAAALGSGSPGPPAVHAPDLPSSLRRAAGVSAAMLVLALPVASFASTALERFRDFRVGWSRFDTYEEAGKWIRANSLPEDRIAYGEIGNLAYWSQRPVDDLLGLVSPRMLPYVAAGDGVGAFLLHPPDFFLDHPASPHPGIANLPWFRRGYEPVARIMPPTGTAPPAVVYRRRPGVRLPPPRPPLPRNRLPVQQLPQ